MIKKEDEILDFKERIEMVEDNEGIDFRNYLDKSYQQILEGTAQDEQ